MQLLNKAQIENLSGLFPKAVTASFSRVQDITDRFNSSFYFEYRLSDSEQVDFLARVDRLDADKLKEFLIYNQLQESFDWLINIINAWLDIEHPFRNKLECIWLEWDNISSFDISSFGVSFTFHHKIRNQPTSIKEWLVSNLPSYLLNQAKLALYTNQSNPAELIHFTLMLQREVVENKFYSHIELSRLAQFYEFIQWAPLELNNAEGDNLAETLHANALFFDIDLRDVGRKVPQRTSVNFIISGDMTNNLKKLSKLPCQFLKTYQAWECTNEIQTHEEQPNLIQTRWLELKWVFKLGELSELKAYWGFHKAKRKLFI
ncbi:hypothetical protein ACSLBF_18805 (plasmid) [Pseudoalteromonas sp. T1lg65]|uniref:hypothetical protein n=1 Tax=Pseudoalteromonas sp. T1lg65 TaxID=2077101 RepID=UPI003F790D6A